MAVLTGGMFVFLVRVIRPMDTGAELLLDAMVTDTAGSGDILGIDQGPLVFRREFRVCAVAIRACRGYYETALDQAPAVNAVFVTADNVVHIRLDARCGLFPDAMTVPTKHGHIARVGR